MNFHEAREAVADAENTMRMADIMAKKVAYVIAGRLKSGDVSRNVLTKLKVELRGFNIATGRWKDY